MAIPPWLQEQLWALEPMQQVRAAACLTSDLPPCPPTSDLNTYACEGVTTLLKRGWSTAQVWERGQAALEALLTRGKAFEAARAHALTWWLTPAGTDYLALLDAGIHQGRDPWALIEGRWGWRPDAQTAAAQLSAYWWICRSDALAARAGEHTEGRDVTLEDLRFMLSQPYTVRDELAVAALRAQKPEQRATFSTEDAIAKAIKEGLV